MTTTPLPEKTRIGVGYFDEHLFGYTEEQMIEYGDRRFAEGVACNPASGSKYPRIGPENDIGLLRKMIGVK